MLAGESITAFNGASLTNDAGGLITIAAGAVLNLSATTLVNAGSIDIAAGGTLMLGGLLSLDSLAGIGGTGSLVIDGTLDLGGGTLDLTADTLLGTALINGTILNGTVVEDGGTLLLGSYATLDGVTLIGTLQPAYENVVFQDGLSVLGAAAGQPGTIDLRYNGNLLFNDTETLANEVILIGNPFQISTNYTAISYYNNDVNYAFSPSVTIVQTLGSVTFYNYYNADIDNFGTFDLSSGTLTITSGLFTNDTSGQIYVNAGETLEINEGFVNAGSISVAAGAR